MASRPNVNSTRLRRSSIAQMLRSVSRRFNLRDLLAGAPCRFDLLPRRSGELRRVHGQLLGQLAVAENFDPVVLALDQAGLAQRRLVDGGAVVETLEVRDVHHGVVFLENVREAALRQAAVQRHLAAFESAHARESGARLLPLLAAAGGLAVARTRTAAHALLGVTRAFFWFEVAEFHVVLVGCWLLAVGRCSLATGNRQRATHSTTSTRCGIFLIMPRTCGVSRRSATRCILPR